MWTIESEWGCSNHWSLLWCCCVHRRQRSSRCVKWHNFGTLGLYCKNIPITKPPLFGHYVNVCGPRPIPNTCGQRALGQSGVTPNGPAAERCIILCVSFLRCTHIKMTREHRKGNNTNSFWWDEKWILDFIASWWIAESTRIAFGQILRLAFVKKSTFGIRKRSDQITTTAFKRRPDKN